MAKKAAEQDAQDHPDPQRDRPARGPEGAPCARSGSSACNDTVEQVDNPAVRGMIFKVKHLVKVEETLALVRGARPSAGRRASDTMRRPMTVSRRRAAGSRRGGPPSSDMKE